ncbi:MAG TPA: cytidine deaminase [Anaerolineales bacterium]|jgi:cytidine deaminase|nr:cytidine deaminase [Anaerolineales bacterium]
MEAKKFMLPDELRQKLIETALEARQWAYTPYSGYAVGAALLTSSDRIYDGVNVENAAYPSSMCAERVAVFRAVSQGERDFVALVVASPNGGTPCGACRQVLAEFGLDTLIIIVNDQGEVIQEATLENLLPAAFLPQDLKP